MYKILINDRTYQEWTFCDPITFEPVSDAAAAPPSDFHPTTHKCFHKDILEFCDGVPRIVKSPVREMREIAGILVLEGNKTFGRTPNKKRLYYKCIPDDCQLPVFLVPFDVSAAFSKKQINKYVLFRAGEWSGNMPTGVLVETLGDVDNLEAFYEYQLYRKSLQVSMKELLARAKRAAAETTERALEDRAHEIFGATMEDRRETHRVITIDNENTTDFDDGISVSGEVVSVYITNVFLVIETLRLWDALTKRVSTIYLPDRRRPMLPSLITDNFCSLREGCDRICFVCDFCAGEVVRFGVAQIRVARNYTYQSRAVDLDETFQQLRAITGARDKTATQPCDIIAHWMIQTNGAAAAEFLRRGDAGGGIYRFRGVAKIPDGLDTETRDVLRTWNYTSGAYSTETAAADTEPYIHITSPIRRLVDLCNQVLFFGGAVSVAARTFVEGWKSQLDYVNVSMRAIKKIQSDCFLLERCVRCPEICAREFEGIVFDRLEKPDVGIVVYMVYLTELKLLSRVSVLNAPDLPRNYEMRRFKIYMFQDKINLRQKIRLDFYGGEAAQQKNTD